MVNKKGYMKTLEAVISIILLLVVVVSIVSIDKYETEEIPQEIKLLQDTILESVQSNESLRSFVYSQNVNSLESFVNSKLDSVRIQGKVQVCDQTTCPVEEELSSDNVYVDSLIIYDSVDSYNYLFRLYLWYNT